MTQTAKPKQILPFQRKDLLTACWGNAREADLLYHFLNSGSWAVTNGVVDESCKNIPLQESHETILKCVPMAEGTLIKDLKRFNLAGYVTNERYGSKQIVNLEPIQAAFTNPPEKPLSAPRGRPKGFKVSRIKKSEVSRIKGMEKSETLEENTETFKVSSISEPEEVLILKQKVLNLELEVLSLKEKVLNLEQFVLNLKLSETRESAPQASEEAKVSLQNDIEDIEGFRSNREKENAATAAPLSDFSHSSSSVDDSDSHSQEPEETKGPSEAGDYGKEETPAQPSLIQRPEKPEMPLASAPWNAKTAYLISEAIRGKYYTENQRTNQQNAAKRMFQDYKSCTREQFEEIFRDWTTWWRDHDKGFFTMADLMARGQNREVRLQTALDRLEARTTTNTSQPAPTPSQRPRAVSPTAEGASARLEPEYAERNKERLKAKYEAKKLEDAKKLAGSLTAPLIAANILV